MTAQPEPIPCPFTYANGRACTGHIVRVEAYKAEARWEREPDGNWVFFLDSPMRYHLFCSEKNGHAGFNKPTPPDMKYWPDELPEPLRAMVNATGIKP
ncbi:hypothetical protein ACM9HJ_08745 [Niveispirillum sp. KHB5.9]